MKKKIKKHRFIIVCISLICACSMIVSSRAIAELTSAMSSNANRFIPVLIVGTLAMYLLQSILESLSVWYSLRIRRNTYVDLGSGMLDSISSVSYDSSFIANRSDSYSRFSNDVEDVSEYLSGNGYSIINQGISMLLVMLYIFTVSWQLALIYSSVLTVCIVLEMFLTRIMENVGKRIKKSESVHVSRLREASQARMLVAENGIYDYALKRVEDTQRTYSREMIRKELIASPLSLIGVFSGLVPVALLIVSGMALVPEGIVSMTEFLSVYYAIDSLLAVQLHYMELFSERARLVSSFDRIETILNAPRWKDSRSGMDIDLSDVCYGYDGDSRQVVNDLSIHLEKGEHVAFVGESGSGKSTALRVMAGLVDPSSGSATVPQSAMAAQEPYIFTDSLKDNIVMDSMFDEQRFYESCRIAHLFPVIEKLEKGIDTILEDNGNSLSGGEKQRISIARTIYSNAPVLLFDEALSALDAETAEEVMKDITSLTDRTEIFILHQMELTRFLDHTYVFKDGYLSGEYDNE